MNFRWSQGLIFHQALVDCARAGILLPLGDKFNSIQLIPPFFCPFVFHFHFLIFLPFCISLSLFDFSLWIAHTFIRVPPSPGYHLARRGIHIGENPARKFILSLNLPGWLCPTKRHKTGLKRRIQKGITFTTQHGCRKLSVQEITNSPWPLKKINTKWNSQMYRP